MDFSAFKKKCGLARIREVFESGPSKSRSQAVARVASDSAIITSSTTCSKALPMPPRSYSAPSSPGRRRQTPKSPVARTLIATFGPTTLRSVLPRRQSSLPQRGRYESSTNSSVSSTSTQSTAGEGGSTASTSESGASTPDRLTEPASPVDAHAGHTPISTTPLDPYFSVNAPVLVQKPAFSPGLAPLPSPCSQFSGEAYAPSPSFSRFFLGSSGDGSRHQHRPSVTSTIGTEESGTEASHSPSSIRAFAIDRHAQARRPKPESPIVATARKATFRASRATFLKMAEHPLIALDMTAATRKPRLDRQDAQIRSPLSPQYTQSPVTPSLTTPVSPRIGNMVVGESDTLDHGVETAVRCELGAGME